MSLASLETRLGHHFGDSTLLEQALTHRSHGARHNERLEFLGDAVLNFVVITVMGAVVAVLYNLSVRVTGGLQVGFANQ